MGTAEGGTEGEQKGNRIQNCSHNPNNTNSRPTPNSVGVPCGGVGSVQYSRNSTAQEASRDVHTIVGYTIYTNSYIVAGDS
jgi:O-acetyl-ADP-ribose deacetylase (regulator of RNase III)